MKIAYPVGEKVEVQGPKGNSIDSESMGTGSHTEMGGRGFNLLEMTSDFDKNQIKDPEKKKQKAIETVDADVFDLLIDLGDGMDEIGEEKLANFSDFLIKKFAQKIDYTKLYNQLMIKINNADLVNTNEILKKLSKIYSRTLILEAVENDIEKAQESAYKKTLHRANQYLSLEE